MLDISQSKLFKDILVNTEDRCLLPLDLNNTVFQQSSDVASQMTYRGSELTRRVLFCSSSSSKDLQSCQHCSGRHRWHLRQVNSQSKSVAIRLPCNLQVYKLIFVSIKHLVTCLSMCHLICKKVL